MVRMDGRWVPTRGTPTVLGVPRAPKGESRGVHPLWQAVMEDVPLITHFSSISPFLRNAEAKKAWAARCVRTVSGSVLLRGAVLRSWVHSACCPGV